MRITIDRATAREVPVLLPLVEAYWEFEGIEGFAPDRVGAQLSRVLAEPGLGAGWIARAGQEAAGYLLAVYVFSLENLGLTVEIDELFVTPAHRGAGVGSALLAAAEPTFIEAGCTCVALQLGRGNDAGRAFYRRLGFRERSGFELLEKTLPRAR